MEEIGRAVAPVPYLSSAVVATVALLHAGDTDTVQGLAAGSLTAALAVPLSAAPGDAIAGLSAGADGVSGQITSVAGRRRGRRAGGAGRRAGRAGVAHGGPRRRWCRGVTGPEPGHDETACESRVLGRGFVPGRLRVGRRRDRSGSGRPVRRCWHPSNWVSRNGVSRPRWHMPRSASSSAGRSVRTRRSSIGSPICGSSSIPLRRRPGTPPIPARATTLDAAIAGAVAQAYCSGAAVHAAEECVQLHGGLGMTWEYPAHLYLKRAKSDQLAFGTAYRHRARLAALVDLPAS